MSAFAGDAIFVELENVRVFVGDFTAANLLLSGHRL